MIHVDLNPNKVSDMFIRYATDLFSIYSPSRFEQPVIQYVYNILIEDCNFKPNDIFIDEFGNLYATRGKSINYPLLNAHADTVQDELDEFLIHNITVDYENDVIHGNELFMLGCDDKSGIAIILSTAYFTNCPLKILITIEEEIGCNGSQFAIENHRDWFNDIGFTFTYDRKNATDIIQTYSMRKMCSDEFCDILSSIGNKYGLKLSPSGGSFADTFYLSYISSACNLSTGYYNPHTHDDYQSISDGISIIFLTIDSITISYRDLLDSAFNYNILPEAPRLEKSKKPSYYDFDNFSKNKQSSFNNFTKSEQQSYYNVINDATDIDALINKIKRKNQN